MAASKELWSSHQPVACIGDNHSSNNNNNSNCILINNRHILINNRNQDCHQDPHQQHNNQSHHNHLHQNHHHYHHGYATPAHNHHNNNHMRPAVTIANANNSNLNSTSSGGSRTTNSTDLSATSSSSITDSEHSRTPPPNYHEIPGIVPSYHGRTSGPPPSYDDVVNPNVPPPSYQSLFGQVREARKSSNGVVDLFRQLFLILIGTIGCTMIVGFLLLIPITMILVGIVYINDCKAENIPSFLIIGGFVWIIKNILNCYNQFKKDSSTANRPPPRRPPISPHLNSRRESAQSTNVLISVGADQHPLAVATGNMNHNHQDSTSLATSQHLNSQVTSNSTTTASTTTTTTTIATTTTLAATTTMIAPRSTRISSTRELQQTNRIRHPTMIGLTSFKCESMLNYFLIVWFLAGCIVVYRMYEPDYDNPLSASYCNRTVYLYAFWLMTSAFIIMAIVLSCLCCLMASSLMSCNPSR